MVRQRQADLLLIAATVIAACGWIFSREAIAGMPVFAFLGLRFFFAALLLLPFCRGFRPQKQHWPKLIISGLWFALNLCLWIYSVSTTASLGEGAFIMSLSMMFVPLTAWVMMKVRPPRAWWECLPIAVVGLGLLSLHMPIAFHPSQGWFLLTALVQSIWFCYTSRCAREVPLIPLTTVQLAITGIVGLTISAAVERWDQPMTLPTRLVGGQHCHRYQPALRSADEGAEVRGGGQRGDHHGARTAADGHCRRAVVRRTAAAAKDYRRRADPRGPAVVPLADA